MSGKAKLLSWATTILALFIAGVTIFFVAEPLVIRSLDKRTTKHKPNLSTGKQF